MSSHPQSSSVPSYGHGYIVQDGMPDYIVGRILTFIETLGLRESQEKSLKDLIRQDIWAQFREGFGANYINPSLNDEVHRVLREINEHELKNTEPGTPINSSYGYEFTITYKKAQ